MGRGKNRRVLLRMREWGHRERAAEVCWGGSPGSVSRAGTLVCSRSLRRQLVTFLCLLLEMPPGRWSYRAPSKSEFQMNNE